MNLKLEHGYYDETFFYMSVHYCYEPLHKSLTNMNSIKMLHGM